MTGAGASEMFETITAGDVAVWVIVIADGGPGVFIRHYDVGELSSRADALEKLPKCHLDRCWSTISQDCQAPARTRRH